VNTRSTVAQTGKVIGTDPSQGSSVSSGGVVTLKVGIGPRTITVPKVKGLSLGDATTKLTQAGFSLSATPDFINSPKEPSGYVVGSTPKEGTPQKPGTQVTLKVASGQVQVPSVKGMSCAQAMKVLQNQTLKPTCQPHPSQSPTGQAFATQPGTNQVVPQHSDITILVSSGPSLVTVPPVTNENVNDAKSALRSAGFKISVTQHPECNDPNMDNIVTAQDPQGNAQAPRGSIVNIVVQKYRPQDPSCGGPPGST
jgi:serine/threonine-protein kinase